MPQDRAVVFTISAVRNKGVNIPFDKQVGIAVHDEVVPNLFSPSNQRQPDPGSLKTQAERAACMMRP